MSHGVQLKTEKRIFQRIILIIFLFIILPQVLGAQKNCFSETVLLSTHNISFGMDFLIMHSYLAT